MPEDIERKPLSVSQAMALAKSALENCTVTLIGEVSEVSNKPGYKAVYFTVKDIGASMPCMMWMNRFKSTGIDLRVGALVQMTGRFTLYAPKGRMNFDVFSLSFAGEGDLRRRVADLARKLQGEGLMEAARKRPLPPYPSIIGIVTSPRGAAVHDVLRTLRRRYPLAKVLLAGVPVEGTGAPDALIAGLQTVAAGGAEAVLLVRGGGSFEDLMPFNDEKLARAIATMPVPVITGIGHEPDTSIADMVADLRASTPTAAAEAVAPDASDLRAAMQAQSDRMAAVLARSIRENELRYRRLATRPIFEDAHTLFSTEAQMLDIMGERIQRAIPGNIARDRSSLDVQRARLGSIAPKMLDRFESSMRLKASRLNDLSPLAVLGRGFALARDEQGAIMRSVDQAKKGDDIEVTLSDGTLSCTVRNSEHVQTAQIPWED